jgi:23S rRNA (guanine2535-N1)-methyltransferase
MTYQYAVERADYADLASGKVFYNHPHQPAFPVRLTSEIFQRCLNLRAQHGKPAPATVYDPCCGSGYLLATLGYLHAENIRHLIGSDIAPDVLRTAGLNLSLLTPTGLAHRRQAIAQLLAQYGKDSHRDALAAIDRMQPRIDTLHLPTTAVLADATDPTALTARLSPATIDIVIADVPYGQHSTWQGSHAHDPLSHLLTALQPFLAPSAVVALCTDKAQKVAHPRFRRVDHFQVGKRRLTLLMSL